ncbi:MAG: glycosyltransferase, partial [bacterium]
MTFLINSLRGGGAERNCVVLSNAFVDKGVSVEIVVLHLNNAVLHTELDSRIKLVNLNIRHARFAVIKIYKYILKNKCQNILVFNHQLAVLLSIIRSLSRHKFRITARNISTLSQKKQNEKSIWHKYIVEYFTRTFYKKVDFIVAQSKGMLLDLKTNYKIPQNKVKVIYNPINPVIEHNYRQYKDLNQVCRKYYLLCVGRLEEVKSFDCAIKTFAKIASDYKDLKLKIVGDGS